MKTQDTSPAFPRPNAPPAPKIRQLEMFRRGRIAAFTALVNAGFEDPQIDISMNLDISMNPTKDHENNIPNNPNSACQASEDLRIKLVGRNPDRSPIWPTGFVGSISHSDRWVLAAAARSNHYRSIGIDSEVIATVKLATTLQPDIGSPSEWKLLADSGIEPTSAFTLLFSAKESFYKCWYPLQKKFLDFLDVAALEIKPDSDSECGPASYGVLTLHHIPGKAHVKEDEIDAKSLRIRYCISANDVFTLATLPS